VLARPARYVPYIYTDQELAALFAQTTDAAALLTASTWCAGAVPHDLPPAACG
jgi:hypothetical protein